MEQKKVTIQKDGVTKKVYAKDLKDFVACGWVEVKEQTEINPFDYATQFRNSLK